MSQSHTEYLTAETARGRDALAEVMEHSYVASLDDVPAPWAMVRVVDNIPVSFILVDPCRDLAFSQGTVPYAFICDVATRQDSRHKGHFRSLMQHTFFRLNASGISVVITHGRYQLYRNFGFEVFTHHSGIFATPALIEAALGTQTIPENAASLLVIENGRHIQPELLLVSQVKATNSTEAKIALLAAAKQARAHKKNKILFEHPPAPSYGSHYPPYPTLETPFTVMARACGAQVCVQGAMPESGTIPDADWIKLLNPVKFLKAALAQQVSPSPRLTGQVCLNIDNQALTLICQNDTLTISLEKTLSENPVPISASILGQLVMGYQSATTLCTYHNLALSNEALTLLDNWFPQQWRLSRNESWTYIA